MDAGRVTIRAPAPAPPVGYRPHMSLRVKLEAALIALGIDPATAEADHDPPLQQRIWDPVAQDTIPPANDPRHIVWRGKADHREKTRGDVSAIAKTKRRAKDQEDFRRAMTVGEPREKKRSRWPKRKMQSRKGMSR